MARPIKDASAEPLDEQLLLRVTKTQKHKLLPEYAATSGMSEADFARNRLFDIPPRQKKATPDRAALIKALGQLGFIRSDINQLLKDRWAYKFVAPEQVDKVFKAIEAIADHIHNDLEHDH